MRIAVCDDESIFREEIIASIENYYGKLDVTCISCEDGNILLEEYEKGTEIEAVILDIEMPVLDGMEAARRLRKKGYEGPVIFLTSHTEMAMDGYEVTAFRFLAKPVQEEKLIQALQDLKSLLFGQKKIAIRYEGEDIILAIDNICYIEAMNNSVLIVLEDKEYTVRMKITDIENMLKKHTDTFIKVHRSYIVNLSQVIRHKGKEIYVTGGQVLPLSRSMAKSFKEQLIKYVKNSAR